MQIELARRVGSEADGCEAALEFAVVAPANAGQEWGVEFSSGSAAAQLFEGGGVGAMVDRDAHLDAEFP